MEAAGTYIFGLNLKLSCSYLGFGTFVLGEQVLKFLQDGRGFGTSISKMSLLNKRFSEGVHA